MLPVTHGDIRAAALVLMARPQADWPALVRTMLAEADCAARHRRDFGHCHPRLGNGSLMSSALAHAPRAQPSPADTTYLQAMAVVIAVVLQGRGDA